MKYTFIGKKPEQGKSIFELDTVSDTIESSEYNEARNKFKSLYPDHTIIKYKIPR